MKKIVTRALAVAIAFTTMVSMSGIMTVNAEAAAKTSNVTVNYTGKATKKAKVKSLAATVDGKTVKNNKTTTVYLTGKKGKVKLDTTVTVNVKNQKMNKKFKNNVGKVTYSSNNKKVATVNKKGVITIKKTGTATITIKSKANTKKTFKIKLKVKQGVKSMTIKDADKNITLKVGAEHKFTPEVKTIKKVKATVTASTSDKNVATVSVDKKTGEVTVKAVAAGEAEVKVAPKFGSGKAQVVKVTVSPIEYKTKVVFENEKADKVLLKGTISWEKQDGIATAVEEFAAALKGNYTVKIDGKAVEVKDGKVVKGDLSKIPASKTKTDAEVEATITIADALKLAGNVDAKATAKFAGSFKMDTATVSNVSLANKVVTFKLGDKELKAFVEGGSLYLDGDQTGLLTLYKEILGKNSLIKTFEKVEK